MKKLAFSGLAAFAIGAAALTTGAFALPAAPGASAHSDMLVQIKHKKHSKKSKKNMDENKDTTTPSGGADDKKGM
jgi:hypothetical protein